MLYVVEMPHTPEECMMAFDGFQRHPRAEEILKNTYAGCNHGNHTGWTIASFENEDEIREMVVLPALQQKMSIHPVDTMTMEEMREAHE